MRYMIDTYGNVDLGTLDWNIDGLNFYVYEVSNNIKKPKDDNTTANIYCNLYRAVPLNASFVEGDMALGTSGRLYIRNTRYTTTAEFKEAMRGQILRYELETPANGGYLPMYKGRYKVSNVCQLLDKSKYPATGTYDGVVYTNNNDGTITLNGTATAYTNYSLQSGIKVIAGHKYLAYYNNLETDVSLLLYTVESNVFDFPWVKNNGWITTCLKDSDKVYYQIKVFSGNTINNSVFKPQLFDLTEMYGAGNEPTTVEQFREKFLDELYPYNRLVSTCCKKMIKVANVCQLLDKSKYPATQTINGVTFTNNGDGTITANGTATANSTFNLIYKVNSLTIIDHKYLLIGCPEGGNTSSTYFLRYDSDGGTAAYDIGNGVIFTRINEKIAYINIRILANYTANNLVFKPQLFDLTEMYGAGNEPTTVAEFREKFPDDLYPYSPYCWAKLKSLIYKDDIEYIKMK